jgi:hypothetical protein
MPEQRVSLVSRGAYPLLYILGVCVGGGGLKTPLDFRLRRL